MQWSFWVVTECEARGFAVLFARGGPQFETWRAWTATEEFRATHPDDAQPSAEQAALAAKACEAALRLAQLDLSPHPRVDAWLTRCSTRPALAAAARR